MLKIKSHKIFFALFLFGLIGINLVNFGLSAEFIVSYQEYTISDSTILEKKNSDNVNPEFAQRAMINFNIDNSTDLVNEYQNMFTSSQPLSIVNAYIPIFGASPYKFVNNKVLRHTSSIDNTFDISHNFDSLNVTQNPKNSFIAYFYTFVISNFTSSYLSFNNESDNYLLFSFSWETNAYALMHNSTVIASSSALETYGNYDYIRTTVYYYFNETIRLGINFYNENGALVSSFSQFISNSFLTDFLIDNILFRNRNNVGINDVFCIDSSHTLYITNEVFKSENVFGAYNDYFDYYLANIDNSIIPELVNGTTLTSNSGQIPFFFSSFYSGPDYWYSKLGYYTALGTYIVNGSVYSSVITNVNKNMLFRCDFNLLSNSNLSLLFTNESISITKNATNISISTKLTHLLLNNQHLSIYITHYLNKIQIILIDELYQNVNTIQLSNDNLLGISFENVEISFLSILRNQITARVINSDYIYNVNYFLEESTDYAFLEVLSHKIPFVFPKLNYQLDEVNFDGKTFYPYEIFITNFSSYLKANSSFQGYYVIESNLHFLYNRNDYFTEYNDIFTSEFGQENKLPNGGNVILSISLLSNASDFVELNYTIILKYAIIFSTDIAFDTYFKTGITLLLPIVILSIFAYGMYSQSRSKFLLGFGFLLGIVVLYLSGMISIGSLILFIMLSLIMIVVFVRKERRSEEL